MHKIAIMAATVLAAGGSREGAAQTPIHGNTPGHICSTEGTERFIGKIGSRRTGSLIKRVSNAAVLRWAPPLTMLTMDFRADRVTIYLGDNHKVTKITCG